MPRVEMPISLTAFGYAPRPATAVVIAQTPGERVGRVLAGLGLFWALALAGLFIPVAHFILVPVFLVAGIVIGIKRWFEVRRLLQVRGPCPRCGAEQAFEGGGRFEDGRSLDCPACHGAVGLAVRESAG